MFNIKFRVYRIKIVNVSALNFYLKVMAYLGDELGHCHCHRKNDSSELEFDFVIRFRDRLIVINFHQCCSVERSLRFLQL